MLDAFKDPQEHKVRLVRWVRKDPQVRKVRLAQQERLVPRGRPAQLDLPGQWVRKAQ